MIIRTALVLALLAVTGCTYSNVGTPKPQPPQTSAIDSQAAALIEVDANSLYPNEHVAVVNKRQAAFDPKAHVAVVNEREVAVIADYIGLSVEEASELANKQKRRAEISWRDNKSIAVTADFVPGRISFHVTDGIVTDANFSCGLDAPAIYR